MGKALGTILSIAVAVFAPYAAAALGLSGIAATAFTMVAQGVVGSLVRKSSLFGNPGSGGSGAGSTGDTGLLVNQQATNNPVYVIYGERRIGANRVFIDTTNGSGGQTGDAPDEYLHQAFSICEGEIGWIQAMYFQDDVAWIHPEIFSHYNGETNPYYKQANDKETISYANWVAKYDTGSGRHTKFQDEDNNWLFNLRLNRGTATQTNGNGWFETDSGTDWQSDEWLAANRPGTNIATAYIRLKYNRDVFSGAPTVQFDVFGRRVEQSPYMGTLVRNDTYANVEADSGKYTNPANCLRDYLTNSLYGKGLNANLIDDTAMSALSIYTSSKGLEVNGVINPTATIFDNTDRLLNTANSFIVQSQGKYRVLPLDELDFTDAYEYSQDNILGEWTIQLGSKKTRMNRVKVNWFNPDENWQADIYTYPESDVGNQYLAEDNDVLNEKNLDLPLVSLERQAQAMGEYFLKLSRYQTVVNFRATWESLKLDVGDPVVITHPTPGWTNRRFRVVAMTLQQDGTVDVTLSEYPDENIWLPNV